MRSGPATRPEKAASGPRSSGWNLELGDFVLFLYLLALVRQYLWVIPSNALAWVLALPLAILASFFCITRRPSPSERPLLAFWLIVAVPLCVVYAMRAVLPDVSFDVLNYRIFHGERALTGFLFRPGDFFPTPAPYNPLPDMVTGLSRWTLGYRLGTAINLLAMLWTGGIIDRILRSHLPNPWRRSVGVLLILLAEHLLFEINNYMIELLALPLLLEATWLALRNSTAQKPAQHLARIAFLLGLSVALKLTNLVICLPLVLLCAYDFLVRHRPLPKELLKGAVFSLGAFAAPLLPFCLYIRAQTGSPLFPVLNGVFKSPYWPANSGWDPRWGPVGLVETILWPLRMTLSPERTSELLVYSGRLSIGCIVALLALILAPREKQLRTLCLITLFGLILWSATTGYIRYGLYLEVLAGIIIVLFAAAVARSARTVAKTCLATLLWLALIAQAATACRYTAVTEWSGRPSIFARPDVWKTESHYLLRDHSLRAFLTKPDRKRFDLVEVWIASSIKTTGLEILLNKKAPVIGLRTQEYFVSSESKARFAKTIEQAAGKRMFALCLAEDLSASLEYIKSRGLEAGAQTPVELPFYSPTYRLGLVLVEVLQNANSPHSVEID